MYDFWLWTHDNGHTGYDGGSIWMVVRGCVCGPVGCVNV